MKTTTHSSIVYTITTPRPDTLEELCLAEFARDYDIVYDSKDNREANQMYTVADEESTTVTIF